MAKPGKLVAGVLARGGIARSMALLAGGNAFLQLALVVSAPISSRLYTPEDYGSLAVFGAGIAVFSYIVCARYDLAIPVADDDRTAVSLLVLGLVATACVSTITAVALWIWGADIVRLLNAERLKPYLWLFPLGLVGVGFYHALSYWAVRLKSYDALAKIRVSQAVSSVALNIGVGAGHDGPLGLLLSNIALSSSGILTLWRTARTVVLKNCSHVSATDLWRVAKRHKQFPLLSVPAGTINTLSLMLCPFLLSAYYGAKIAGWFALAQRTMNMPTGLIGGAVYQVWLGEASETARNAPQELGRRFDRLSTRLLALASLVLVVGLVAPFVFGFVFGPAWHKAGLFAALVTPFYASQLVVIPVSTTTVIAKRQDLQFGIDLVRCVLVCFSLIVPHKMGLGPEWSVGAYGASMFVMNIACFPLYRAMVTRPHPPVPEHERDTESTGVLASNGGVGSHD
ncbi:MAG: lipopolysaccharide biosynthesis protein [Armatimonadota bacterium]